MAETQVLKQQQQAPAVESDVTAQRRQTPETERVYLPDVDIWEDADGIRLVADMPGVNPKAVQVTLENDVLTIEGAATVEVPQGYELVGQEYGVGRYRRDFVLADSLNTDGIQARMSQGILEVTIPKREEVKPRTIKIES